MHQARSFYHPRGLEADREKCREVWLVIYKIKSFNFNTLYGHVGTDKQEQFNFLRLFTLFGPRC